MTDKDRIENAIRHIQTATDVDPWAMEIAVDAMQKELKNSSGTDINVGSTDDMISRRTAIDSINGLTYPSSLVDVKRVIQDLSSAQPERETGRWYTKGGMIYCSNCANSFDVYFANDFIYCPKCGTKMEETDE